MDKIISQNQITKIVKKLKKSGKKIVFTNGCFDILHIGHTRLLNKAKSFGDILIVGLNSDSSVKKIKGEHRPVISENERAEVLAAVSSVDFIVKFSQPTPYELIKKIMPDILVKGADWKNGKIVGSEFVKKVVRIPLVKGCSTTKIIEKLKNL
ncbi:MAG: D-glycero-beta-D-manno-heptose 1-phosphate adenylyltransferase [Elusimicrobia bacterium HGW-Elusimicrobia-4]|nr:MAG: D-glycero-beta-D-manno-heptose 1-phosphate adenylyltransferase [Elusimicrobia bacterium HGW-Elusimicrobia-4]